MRFCPFTKDTCDECRMSMNYHGIERCAFRVVAESLQDIENISQSLVCISETLREKNNTRAEETNVKTEVIIDKRDEAYRAILKADAERRMQMDGVQPSNTADFVNWCWEKNAGHWPDGTFITDD